MGYCGAMAITDLPATGAPLGEVQREAESGLESASPARFASAVALTTGLLRLIPTVRALTRRFVSFSVTEFDEGGFEQHLARDPGPRFVACWYWIRKLQARFLAGAYVPAIEAAENARPLLWTSVKSFDLADYHLYAAL